MSSLTNLTTTDRLKILLPQLFDEQRRDGNYYLRFQLTSGISALIDLKYVQESLTVDGTQITAVPNLPEYVVGLMSSRNQVFLAVDLAHLAGFPPETVNLRQYQTIVIQIDSVQQDISSDQVSKFGLTVKSIQGISRITSEQFRSSGDNLSAKSSSLSNFVQGSVALENQAEALNSDAVEHSYLIDISKLIQTKIEV